MPALLADHRPATSSSSSSTPSSSSPPFKKPQAAHQQPSLDSSLHVQTVLTELLSNPLKFEKSKLQPPKVKYPPINADQDGAKSSKAAASKMTMDYDDAPRGPVASTSKLDPVSASPSSSPSLYSGRIPLTWPREAKSVGAGFHNRGNTCYMNSTMQALVHTAPLAHLLLTQDAQLLKGKYGGAVKNFDAVKALQTFTQRAIGKSGGKHVTTPEEFIRNLKSVAKTFHHGRQEDAHEWLRLLLDSLQQACLAEATPKAKQSPLLREATFIHKIFGGKLRSRVTCLRCKHHSDTFDPILDLSLDIRRCNSLKDAFTVFTDVEELRGSEKYRCEKCKGLVNAEKHFKIEQAPNVLTVHLKRFTFTGAKITRPIAFADKLRLKGSWTSSGQEGPLYSLFAVVHHYGGGPHSGHYVAEVKSPAGKWYNMNDEMVSQCSKPGQASKSAYILFYVREGGGGGGNGEALAQAISTATSATTVPQANGKGNSKGVANGKAAPAKRPFFDDEEEEDLGTRSMTTVTTTAAAGSPSSSSSAATIKNSSPAASINGSSSAMVKAPHLPSKTKGMMKKDRSVSSPLANAVRSPYAASYGSFNAGGSPPSASRFSISSAANQHGSDFLNRIGGGGGGGKKKKQKFNTGSGGGGGGGIFSPVDPAKFHGSPPPPSGGGGGKGGLSVRQKMKGRNST